jgi:hypothetical protein
MQLTINDITAKQIVALKLTSDVSQRSCISVFGYDAFIYCAAYYDAVHVIIETCSGVIAISS